MLRGAVMIVYPMNLPPHDNIRLEIENNEDLEGTHASLEVRQNVFNSFFFAKNLCFLNFHKFFPYIILIKNNISKNDFSKLQITSNFLLETTFDVKDSKDSFY